MKKIALCVVIAAMAGSAMATVTSAQSGFGVQYASDDCNHEPSYLEANEITCRTVFAATSVWDFLNGLPRRITLEELAELNPNLEEVTYDTVIPGITFVRVR